MSERGRERERGREGEKAEFTSGINFYTIIMVGFRVHGHGDIYTYDYQSIHINRNFI